MSDTSLAIIPEPDGATAALTGFSFTYRGIAFQGHRAEAADGHVLHLGGSLAPLPYSAEAPQARVALSTIVMHANNLLGPRFSMADQRIRIIGAIPIASGPEGAAPDSAGIVTAVARFLIPLAPYLDLLDVYLLPGGAGIRPEWMRNRRAAAPRPALALTAPGR